MVLFGDLAATQPDIPWQEDVECQGWRRARWHRLPFAFSSLLPGINPLVPVAEPSTEYTFRQVRRSTFLLRFLQSLMSLLCITTRLSRFYSLNTCRDRCSFVNNSLASMRIIVGSQCENYERKRERENKISSRWERKENVTIIFKSAKIHTIKYWRIQCKLQLETL